MILNNDLYGTNSAEKKGTVLDEYEGYMPEESTLQPFKGVDFTALKAFGLPEAVIRLY